MLPFELIWDKIVANPQRTQIRIPNSEVVKQSSAKNIVRVKNLSIALQVD